MMKTFSLLLAVVLSISILLGCSDKEPVPLATEDEIPATPSKSVISSKTYTNTEYSFSVEYPVDWDLNENLSTEERQAGRIVIFSGSQVAENDRRVRIIIEADKWSKDATVEQYATAVEMQVLKKNLSDYINLHERTTTIDEIPAIVRTFTATIDGLMQKDVQAYFTKDDFAYVITYDVTTEYYDTYVDCFELAINTFKFE